MTGRHTVDSITSDALDQLYDRLARAEAAIARVRAVAGWALQGWSDLSPEKVLLAVEGEQPAPAPAATQAIEPDPFSYEERERTGRNGGLHQFTALPVDPEAERAATERAVQAAADSERGTSCTCGGRFPLQHLHADQHQPTGNHTGPSRVAHTASTTPPTENP